MHVNVFLHVMNQSLNEIVQIQLLDNDSNNYFAQLFLLGNSIFFTPTLK